MDGRNVQYSSKTPGGGGNAGGIITSKVGQADGYDRQQEVADNVKQSKDYKNELNQQLSNATKTELLPGVTLEGLSYDL